MKNLLQFIVKFHFLILFILIEIFCFLLISRFNNYQKTKILNSSNALSGSIYSMVSCVNDYLSLAEINEKLIAENTQLHNLSKDSYRNLTDSSVLFTDSLYKQQYVYRWAKVINNSVNKQLNYITLNKGRLQGIKPEMAVISEQGVVGKVLDVSDNFATVISLLNNRFNISAKIKKNNYFGPLMWDRKNYRKAQLLDISTHVSVNKGDTIVTSGYSSVFPEGKLIGTVSDVGITSDGNFLSITVLLSTDFKNLSYVGVVENLMKMEKLELENKN